MSDVDSTAVLDLLHDHYKDSFTNIRERERRRDRLFVTLVLLFTLLVLEVQYPAATDGALGTLSIGGVQVSVGDLPLAALLDVTWLMTLLVGLKYCQTALAVERQYPYLHRLEEAIGERLGDPSLFCREGAAYLHAYPTVLNWAWFCYVIVFPVALLVGTGLILTVMWRDLPYGGWHKTFSSAMAATLVLSFALYQVGPRFGRVVAAWGAQKDKRRADSEQVRS